MKEERPRFAALHSGNFRLLWSGLIVSNAGTQMQSVAQGYLIYYVLTHSTFWLGVASLAFALPMTFFPLFGGAIADRVDKLTLLKITQTGQMASAGLLTLVTFTGQMNVWWILAMSFVGATFLAADNPARQALLPELVPREDLVSAAALNAASFTGAALIGPAIGGFLLPIAGPGGLFLLNTISFLAVLGALFGIRGVDTRPHPEQSPFGESLRQLFAYIKSARVVGLVLLLSALIGLFGRSYLPLTPAFGRDLLHVDAAGLGLLYAAPGLGSLVGAGLLAGRKATYVGRGLLIGATLCFGLLLIAYSFNPLFALSLLLLTGVGAASQVSGTMVSTTLQLETPARLRGRVMSLYAITIIGLSSLGGLGSGLVAAWIGPSLAVSIGAALMLAAALLIAPRLRGMEP
ncbi:MAG: MFS transporter [Chloroflexia bacterium]